MFKKKILVVALILIMSMSLALTGCGGTDTPAEKPADAAPETIKLGLITPKTGDIAQYGLAVDNAVNLAINEINANGGVLGKQIELIAYDNKGDATESVTAFNKLVSDDKIDLLLGPVISSTSLAVAPLAQEEGIPMVTPTATNLDVTVGRDFVFRVCFTDPYQGRVVGKFAAVNLEAKTAAVLTNTGSDYSVGISEAFIAEFTKNGGTIVNDEPYSYNAADTDFKVVLTNIKEEAPDVIFIPDYYNKVGDIATQAKEVGIKATLLGADGWDSVQKEYGDVVEGFYFANHYAADDPSEVVQNFIKSYEEAYGEVPNALGALGYDAAYTAITAIEKAGTTDKEAVRDAIAATEVSLVTGNIKFDENGDTIKGTVMLTIKDGELMFFDKVAVD